MSDLFAGAQIIMDRLLQAGYQAYMVGGCVRDYLLNRDIGDIDIATSALPEVVCSLFAKTIPVGMEHGTVIVRVQHISYEVTTFRKEGTYVDRRHPSSVEYIDSLFEDLSRRDFTINAMAMDAAGNLHDPFGGSQHLKDKKIKTVGDAEKRFMEDPLRIMRALRFWAVLGFTLEEETEKACKRLADELKEIAVERLAAEFIKLLRGIEASSCLRFMFETGVVSSLPELNRFRSSSERLYALDWACLESDEERWAALLFLLGEEDPAVFLKAWKQSNALIRSVLQLIRYLDKEELRPHDLYELGELQAVSCQRVRNAVKGRIVDEDLDSVQKRFQKLPIHQRKELAVNGKDIVSLDESEKGPWIQEMLQRIEHGVVEGKVLNEKRAIMEWVRSWKGK
ncbi:CCA tRNA nucleotidyltransferase [Fictibacillus sp. KIGAM418]|uniref:CCA-adding enzyme n=1 Tax=Fictibacillus marinisediminis TaxID=2878389 RepID=A0A9X1XEA7_9BACL|nr:CCA tRNA nucleotidyltransferase [Fictibacillus marinisediminis]MCK6257490.1 CCA tRNA nucleotidyltransferase [Fictibacillus marinisediminis]